MTTITIGGREFRIGATYAPKPKRVPWGPRTLLSYSPEPLGPFMAPLVSWQEAGGAKTSGTLNEWLAWAGDEVAP